MSERTFLEEAAERILSAHSHDLTQVCLVVPGKRAGIFLKKAMGKISGKPLISPRIETLPGFFSLISGVQPQAKLSQVFSLYTSYLRIEPLPDAFPQFLKWATTALDDFGDLDHSLVKPEHFFRELRSIREIENWSFSADPLSDTQLRFESFWKMLGPLYVEYSGWNNPGYSQLVRQMAEGKIQPVELPGHTWFLGLSSLTPAEQILVRNLEDSGAATSLWDLDNWYCDHSDHSGGLYFRKHLRSRNVVPANSFAGISRDVHVVSCTTALGQVWSAHQRLKELTLDELGNTAVVIMDPGLVSPFLTELPDLGGAVNIAMGIPFRHDALFTLLDDLLDYQRRLLSGRIHHPALLRILSNPICQSITGVQFSRVQEWLTKGVRVYIRKTDHDDLALLYPKYAEFASDWLTTSRPSAEWLKSAVTLVRNRLESPDLPDVDREAARRMHRVVLECLHYVEQHNWLQPIESLQTVFRQLISRENVIYSGEPLSGMQVLGMVETRAVDFDQVLVLGANEDLLPVSSPYQSLFPFDLRRYHGLPLPADREASYAYTFYRLLQRCRRADLYYCTITSDFRGTEQSRYISQLEIEIASRPNATRITRRQYHSPSTGTTASDTGLPRSAFSDARIREWMERGISPSALGAYLRCPQDFYYRYVLGIREQEDLEVSFSEATFGSVVHLVMEHFMRTYTGGFPSDSNWDELIASLDLRIRDACAEAAPGHDPDVGFNRIQVAVMREMLLQLIAFERENHREWSNQGKSHTIIAVEENLEAQLPEHVHQLPCQVRLAGKADRIDLIDQQALIIDYKTGKVRQNGKKVRTEIASLFTSANQKLIQILSYAYMYGDSTANTLDVNAALLSLREIAEGYYDLADFQQANPTWRAEFEQQLGELVQQIATTSHFSHHPDSTHCQFCNTL